MKLIAAVLLAFAFPAAVMAGEPDVREWKWHPFWSRDAGAGKAATDGDVLHDGKPTTRIEHRGERDWALQPAQEIPVKEGDILELSAWLKVLGGGNAELSATTRDDKNDIIEWTYGSKHVRESKDGEIVRTQFVIPKGVATIQPRLTGHGAATVWMEGFRLQGKGSVESLRKDVADEIRVENETLSVAFHPRETTFAVTDKRTGQTWSQKKSNNGLIVTGAKATGRKMRVDLLDAGGDLTFTATLALEKGSPEFLVTISGDGPLPSSLPFPHPFVTATNTYLVVPMNEGISYPVTDTSIQPFPLVAYGGHGICMAFFGATDGERGQMAILETADDAVIRIARLDGLLAIAPEWQSQKGRFGYERKIRYAFFDRGGHVAMCKRYREHARQNGLLKTFTEKKRDRPQIDQLVGAVNTWCWEKDAVGIVREMKAAGMDRILWSASAPADVIQAMNDMGGVLTSRYDIYQDVMNPSNFPQLRYVHGDWTTEAWPKDLMIGPRGDWIHGWEVESKDGRMIPCGVTCDQPAVAYAAKRIAAELQTRPYRGRFIDTTTAAPWRECYSPDHPLTRTQSREWKMKLLGLISGKFDLVCGSETGHDAAVPVCDFFEGMLSLGPYRVPDSGRRMQEIWTNVPERVAKFQVGHAYRLPLWELVYHDCLAAHWYWGDYNNKLPALWDKRDLFNILYGTAPMFMFNRKLWNEQKERFAASYQKIAPVARATGYSEMLDHQFLTPDRSVQRTKFADGTIVTVNFGEVPFALPGGATLPPLGHLVAHAP